MRGKLLLWAPHLLFRSVNKSRLSVLDMKGYVIQLGLVYAYT